MKFKINISNPRGNWLHSWATSTKKSCKYLNSCGKVVSKYCFLSDFLNFVLKLMQFLTYCLTRLLEYILSNILSARKSTQFYFYVSINFFAAWCSYNNIAFTSQLKFGNATFSIIVGFLIRKIRKLRSSNNFYTWAYTCKNGGLIQNNCKEPLAFFVFLKCI